MGAFAERFAGSSDIFKREGRLSHGSLNFITAHDGFTLRDLVSITINTMMLTVKRTVTDAMKTIATIIGIEGSQLDLADEMAKCSRK